VLPETAKRKWTFVLPGRFLRRCSGCILSLIRFTPRSTGCSLYWVLRGYISLHLFMQDPRGSVQALRQSSVLHLVVQVVVSILQSSMHFCRSRLVSDAADETAVKISRAVVEMARARYPDVTAFPPFAPRVSVATEHISNGSLS
jgi:hypothetical protein